MKFLISLAWKNLSRYKRRTIITALAIAVGLALYIFIDALLLGAETESERNLILYETSTAQIMTTANWKERDAMSLKYLIDNPRPVETQLDKIGAVWAPRVTLTGELEVRKDPFEEDGTMPVRIIAIDPEIDDRVFSFKNTVEEGRYLRKDEESIMIGSNLAQTLGAKAGYPVTIVTRTKDGYFQTIQVKVAGIINCPNPAVNKGTVFMPLATADYYLDLQGAVSSIAVHFPFYKDTGRVTETLEKNLPLKENGLSVYTWKEMASDYIAIAEAKKSGSSIILLLVFIIAAVGVTNTMLMAIYERIRELGMMRALGMEDKQIRRAFLLEAGGIGFIGSAIGVLLGVGITAVIVFKGMDLTRLIKNMDIGYRISGVMYGAWHPQAIVIAFFVGIILSVLVAFFPTRKAMKMEITDCLRHQ